MTEMAVVRVAAPVRQQVAEHLRNALLRQRFAPGERLVERHLCELTGASRASVREALRHLETEGLVVSVPQVGMVVASVSREDAEVIYAVRGVSKAWRPPAVHGERDAGAAHPAAAAVKAVHDAPDAVRELDAKDDFYRVLIDGAGSAVIGQLLSTLHARVAVLRARSSRTRTARGRRPPR